MFKITQDDQCLSSLAVRPQAIRPKEDELTKAETYRTVNTDLLSHNDLSAINEEATRSSSSSSHTNEPAFKIDTSKYNEGSNLVSSSPVASGPITTTSGNTNHHPSSGFYDAEKCRAHIANQIKVSKIDRFASQVALAVEVEKEMQFRLSNLMNMFTKRSCKVAHDFSLRCKLALRGRLLDQRRKRSHPASKAAVQVAPLRRAGPSHNGRGRPAVMSKSLTAGTSLVPVTDDLLYGRGAQLMQKLLAHSNSFSVSKQTKRRAHQEELLARLLSTQSAPVQKLAADSSVIRSPAGREQEQEADQRNQEADYLLPAVGELFEPSLFVGQLEQRLLSVLAGSRSITHQLTNMRQLFERLALEHRGQVDAVYAAEEERQASAGVVRRSTYNLSIAASRATSTPVHRVSTSTNVLGPVARVGGNVND